MKFTNSDLRAGEMACRNLSDKAKWYYLNTDPLHVYGRDGRFFVRGSDERDDLSFEELEELLAQSADEFGYQAE